MALGLWRKLSCPLPWQGDHVGTVRWDKGISFLHGPGTKGKMRIMALDKCWGPIADTARGHQSPCGSLRVSIGNLHVERKPAAQQGSQLGTATEKSEIPKAGPLPRPGIHMLLACLHGQVGALQRPGDRFCLECVQEAVWPRATRDLWKEGSRPRGCPASSYKGRSEHVCLFQVLKIRRTCWLLRLLWRRWHWATESQLNSIL